MFYVCGVEVDTGGIKPSIVVIILAFKVTLIPLLYAPGSRFYSQAIYSQT